MKFPQVFYIFEINSLEALTKYIDSSCFWTYKDRTCQMEQWLVLFSPNATVAIGLLQNMQLTILQHLRCLGNFQDFFSFLGYPQHYFPYMLAVISFISVFGLFDALVSNRRKNEWFLHVTLDTSGPAASSDSTSSNRISRGIPSLGDRRT